MIDILKENGDKKVRIETNKYGTEMHLMTNGNQWVGFNVDTELLKMVKDAINEYLALKKKELKPMYEVNEI